VWSVSYIRKKLIPTSPYLCGDVFVMRKLDSFTLRNKGFLRVETVQLDIDLKRRITHVSSTFISNDNCLFYRFTSR
jgi:hypothetical protein